MTNLAQAFSEKYCKETVPDLRSGYQIRVYQKIKEGNKERIQVFQGMVIKVGSGSGVSKTFTVRKISNGIGVEKIFPIHSPSIVKITVLRSHKVRRANLKFLRNLSGKALRLKEIPLKLKEIKTKGQQHIEKIEKVLKDMGVSKEELVAEEVKEEERSTVIKEETKEAEAIPSEKKEEIKK